MFCVSKRMESRMKKKDSVVLNVAEEDKKKAGAFRK